MTNKNSAFFKVRHLKMYKLNRNDITSQQIKFRWNLDPQIIKIRILKRYGLTFMKNNDFIAVSKI